MTGPSRVATILAGNIVVSSLATIFCFACVYSRAHLLRAWEIDDHLMIFSWPPAMVSMSLSCAETRYGASHHEAEVSLSAAQMNLKLSFIDLFFYTTRTAMTKFSMCLFYLRIFHPERRSRLLIYACIFLIPTTTLAFTIFNTFQCHPIRTYWDLTLQAHSGNCKNPTPVFSTTAKTTTLTST
ncbi:hypothetical protein AOQ84DRAFT_72253 [Glonium stellatum]|uniref:Rhodopsin domain-containing protein n=1 Tax=Glonium stellatum TaxID=574774 RepID=A0A8E2EY67_9PEZI|nr:hypothetical protein AOQ84DRAFT_72253 [Glonium stellatum]